MLFSSRATLIASCLLLFIACKHAPEYYLERGGELFEEGEYASAIIEYRKALQRDGNLGEAYYRIALCEIERTRPQGAYSALLNATRLSPENLDAKLKLAEMSLAVFTNATTTRQALADRITELANGLLADAPKSFEGITLKGRLALLDQRYPQAVEFFERAVGAHPDEGRASVWLTEALLLADRGGEAEKIALELVERSPSLAAPYDQLARYYRLEGEHDRAEEILRQRVEANPEIAEHRIKLAEFLSQRGRTRESEEELEAILASPGGFDGGPLVVGEYFMRHGNHERAAEAFQSGLDVDAGRRTDYLPKLADALVGDGQPIAAIEALQKAAEDSPDNIDLRAKLAELLRRHGGDSGLERAIELYQQLRREEPDDATFAVRLGQAFVQQLEYKSAHGEYLAAANMRADLINPRVMLAALSLRDDRTAEGLRWSAQALELEPENSIARFYHALAAIALRDFETAKTDLNRLANRYPNSADVQLQLGLLALYEGRDEEAVAILTNIDPGRPGATEALAQAFVSQKEFEKAQELLRSRVEEEPASDRLRRMLAAVLDAAGDHPDAVELYARLVEESPEDPSLATLLGSALARDGRVDLAAAEFARARALTPDDVGPVILLAMAREQQGKQAEASDLYREALRLSPDNAIACNNLAGILSASGQDLDEALELADRAVRRLPRSPLVKDTLGLVYLARGTGESALQIFRGLVEQQPEEAAYHAHLGLALAATGDLPGARRQLAESRRLGVPQELESRLETAIRRAGPQQ